MKKAMIVLGMALAAIPASAQFNIQRKAPPTPEVVGTSPAGRFQSGKTHVVTYTVKYWDAAAAQARADEPCAAQSVSRVSPGVYRVTVATKVIGYQTDCRIVLTAAGLAPLSLSVPLIPDAAEKKRYDAEQERERAEREAREQQEQKEAMDKQSATLAAFQSRMGKRWDVKFGSGKTETWTLATKTDYMAHFKVADGKAVMVMPGDAPGEVMVMMGGCGSRAHIGADGTVQGDELAEMLCGKGKAGKWSAKITK
jgi:hypothetical protein